MPARVNLLLDPRTLVHVQYDGGVSSLHGFAPHGLLMTRLDGAIGQYGHYPPQETSGIISSCQAQTGVVPRDVLYQHLINFHVFIAQLQFVT